MHLMNLTCTSNPSLVGITPVPAVAQPGIKMRRSDSGREGPAADCCSPARANKYHGMPRVVSESTDTCSQAGRIDLQA